MSHHKSLSRLQQATKDKLCQGRYHLNLLIDYEIALMPRSWRSVIDSGISLTELRWKVNWWPMTRRTSRR